MQIGLLIFLLSMGYNIVEGMEYGLGYNLKQMALIDGEVTDDEKWELEKNVLIPLQGEVNVFESNYFDMRTCMLFFNINGTPFVQVKPNELEYFMRKLGIVLIEGELPSRENQILVTRETLKSYDAQMGDWIGKDYRDEALDNNYQICGVIKGRANIYIGMKNKPTQGYLVVYEENQKEKIEPQIMDVLKRSTAINYHTEGQLFAKTLSRNMLLLGVVVVGIFFISILAIMLNLLSNELGQRLGEITLLRLIGYSYKTIKKQLWWYYGIILLLGAILGIGTGVTGVILFKYLYCEGKGIYLEVWHNSYLLIVAVMIIVLYGIAMWWIEQQLSKNSWQKNMYE